MSQRLTERQRALLEGFAASGYLATLERWAKRCTAPFWWREPARTEDHPFMGGTICFVHTGTRLLGITAAHIHEAYRSRLNEGHIQWCQIGGHSFDPVARLIDIEPHSDIATYDLSEVQVNAADADIHYAPAWPPLVEESDVSIVGGWPWRLSTDSPDQAHHYFLHFIAKVSTASENQIGVVTQTTTSIPWGNTSLPPGTNLGGMSGGPVYKVSETGLVALTLVGVISQYQPGFEIALARPLRVVGADGTIRRTRA
jgi:hypothetical protein